MQSDHSSMISGKNRRRLNGSRLNEPLLEEIAASDLAVISRPGRLRSLVQVICRRRAGASRNLVREFGGVARATAAQLVGDSRSRTKLTRPSGSAAVWK